MCFVSGAPSLMSVAGATGSHHVAPTVMSSKGYRNDMVTSQERRVELATAIHADMLVTEEKGAIGKWWHFPVLPLAVGMTFNGDN